VEKDDLLAGALVGEVQCEYLPAGYIDYDSEGQAIACGYTTVSIVDGNIDASQNTTDQAKDRINPAAPYERLQPEASLP
jgi:hypothetical protein